MAASSRIELDGEIRSFQRGHARMIANGHATGLPTRNRSDQQQCQTMAIQFNPSELKRHRCSYRRFRRTIMASYLGRSEVPCQTSPAAPRRADASG